MGKALNVRWFCLRKKLRTTKEMNLERFVP